MAPIYNVDEVVMLKNHARPPKFITITSVRTRANSSYEYDGIYPKKNMLNQIRFKTITVPEANILTLVKTTNNNYVYPQGLLDSYAVLVESTIYDTEFSTAQLYDLWGGPGANAGDAYDAEAAAMEASIQASSETHPHPGYHESNSNEGNSNEGNSNEDNSNEGNSNESNNPGDPNNLSNNGNPKNPRGGRRKQKRTKRRFKKSATRKRR